MTSDGKSTKTKVIDLDENYNFVVNDFSVEIIWYPNSMAENFEDLKFKFVKRSGMAKPPTSKL